jgi:DNA repair protein RecN (Recombination protein N)
MESLHRVYSKQMLTHLVIHNFALISTLELDLKPGFTVLTGETGAGKSIIIDAIGLLLGNPSHENMIQSGQEEAIVEGVFTLKSSDQPMIVYRKISRNKANNSAKINGETVTLKALKQRASEWINIIGQHEHTHLFSQEKQMRLLDSTSDDIQGYHARYLSVFKTYKALEKKLLEEEKMAADLIEKKDFIQFQLDELAPHGFSIEEEETLNTYKKNLKNQQRFLNQLRESQSTIDSIQEGLNTLRRQIPGISEMGVECESWHETLLKTGESLEEYTQALFQKAQELNQWEKRDIEDVESRLDLIFKLKTKYKKQTLAELISYQHTLESQLEQANAFEHNNSELIRLKTEAFNELTALGKELTKARLQTAKTLSSAIESTLKELHFTHPTFVIEIKPAEAPLESGFDTIDFLLSANPGEPPKPLIKIASGGELSRVMLALKSVSYQSSSIETLIFDEIDTGVGGITANTIGNLLYRISESSQVLCITHLPQIAHLANNHLYIRKEATSNRTDIHANWLSLDEKKQELLRMVGGESVLENLVEKPLHQSI